MAETTSSSISQKVHGSGIANCGSYPTITAKFTITFTRETPNSPEISWQLTMASRSSILPTSTTASFGYKLFTYVRIDDGPYYNIISKNNTQATNWTSSTYTKLINQSGTFTSTESTAWIGIYCKSRECQTSGHACYQGSGTYTYIKGFSVQLPPYVSQSTIAYYANGGEGAPETQVKEGGVPITLSTTIPVYELPINYHNPVNPTTVNLYRPFIEWNTDRLGQGTSYAPGDEYTLDESCVLFAQWGDAILNPIALDPQYITVTYSSGGVPILPSQHYKEPLGYSTSEESTVVEYLVGSSYNIAEGIDLYPLYADATVRYDSLPTPVRSGYSFDGWYLDPDLTQKVSGDISTSEDVVLYAKWTYLPIRNFDGDHWNGSDIYVWQFLEASDPKNPKSSDDWNKIAPIYQFDYFNNDWINISNRSIAPYGIFNYPEGRWAVSGLRQQFEDGLEQNKQHPDAEFNITETSIDKQGANARLSLGAICYKGAYHTLCIEVEVNSEASMQFKSASIGVRYASHGNKGETYLPIDMDVQWKLVDYSNRTNYIRTEPWDEISRQVVKFDLSQVTQDPFYLLLHACDVHLTIYSIWLE